MQESRLSDGRELRADTCFTQLLVVVLSTSDAYSLLDFLRLGSSAPPDFPLISA